MKFLFLIFMLPFLSFSQEKVKTSNFFDDLTEEERRIIVLKAHRKTLFWSL